jgi:UDP-3-O-[3-hydroxymyristoyl] glucosamine N-acyltransferase
MLYDYFNTTTMVCLKFSLEEIKDRDQEWFDQYQFLSVTAKIDFKQQVVETLQDRNPHYVSVISNTTQFCQPSIIGHNTFIQHFCIVAWDNIVVGDHCTISGYTTLGHKAHIGDFNHISGYSFINYATLGKGNVVGLRSSIFGTMQDPITTTDYCNLMANSTITKSIDLPGTYFGNRYVNSETSLTKSLV